MKTKDNFFSGFPAAWNLVILYFFVLDSPPFVNFGLVLLLGVLTFVPMKFIHPFRVAVMRPVTIVVTVVWAAAALYLVLTSGGADAQPAIAAPLAFWAFVAASVYHLALSLWRSVRGRAG
jgi:phosphatidylcholine synthase